ncbi:MAG: toll/interleukin-1 receptor domain-containing protein [Thermoanaerobaculia bacterium]
MANAKHVRIIKSGTAAWNQWRQEEPEIWPDLISAPLRGLSLDGINLENANLHRADLESASLVGAKLRNTNLGYSRLIGANLQEASLREANLYNADLRDANLEGADLRNVNMSKARFDGTRLDRSIFEETDFDTRLLIGALGIDTIYHKEPWSVDLGILEEAGRLLADKPHQHQAATQFFKNARVPDHLLMNHFTRRVSVAAWYTCFVSYSHQDSDFADLLCGHLQEIRVPYWRDTHSKIPVGSDILNELTRAIVAYDKVLLCCSESSLTSSWFHEEIGLALDKEQKLRRDVLLPLDIDGYLRSTWKSPYSPLLNRRFIADFSSWREGGAKLKDSFEQVSSVLRVS